jgi:hypothetical protein
MSDLTEFYKIYPPSNNKELKDSLYKICEDILKDIIEPSCGMCGICIDYWDADIQMFTLDDEVLDEEILEKIATKYNLSENDKLHIDTWEPLIQIALFIYLDNHRPSYGNILNENLY